MANKTTDQIVAELADREGIRDIVVRYYDAVWREDVAGIVDLFAENGSFRMKGGTFSGQQATGRAALLKLYQEGLSAMSPRPYLHNHVIDLTGNGWATGRCYIELRSGRDFNWIGAAIYEDEYVKVGDQWKFQTRTATAVHGV
jgi:hypothetical protein